jgi:lipopolysaccharide/colanic/teichoic acid biosynthesis glycosyltransferase
MSEPSKMSDPPSLSESTPQRDPFARSESVSVDETQAADQDVWERSSMGRLFDILAGAVGFTVLLAFFLVVALVLTAVLVGGILLLLLAWVGT